MDIVTQVILPGILAFIMFSMGLALTVDDFKRVAKFPKAFIVGCVLQMVSLPVIACIIARAWVDHGWLDSTMAIGLVIIAACPGGVTSNLMTHLGKGDTALSISLTAVIGVLSVFTIPFIVNYAFDFFLGSEQDKALPIGKTIVGIFAISTVPVILGMLIKAHWPKTADRWEPRARRGATVFFVLIVVAAFIKKWALIEDSFGDVGSAVLLLNLITMALAIGVSRLMGLSQARGVAITFECGLQNGTLAIMIALTFLGSEVMMVPAGIYSLLMFVTGGIYLFVLKKQSSN